MYNAPEMDVTTAAATSILAMRQKKKPGPAVFAAGVASLPFAVGDILARVDALSSCEGARRQS